MDDSSREYLNAKFSGLKDLLEAQDRNLNGYIKSVSADVQKVAESLAEHKDSTTAHGIEVREKSGSNVVAWGGLVVAILALLGPVIAAALK